jgi:endoglucanase
MQSRTPVLSRCIVGLVAALMIGAFIAAPASAKPPAPDDQLYVPPAQKGAKEQIAELTAQGDKAEAAQIRAITDTPQAVWFEAGTPKSVKQDVRLTVKRAAAKRSVPVLVTYNIPFRDCAQSRDCPM